VNNADKQFYTSVIACLRALANDASLKVTVGETSDADSGDLNLPLLSDTQNKSLVSLVRGLSDSFAMMRLYHDPAMHAALAPQELAADRLFSLLEKERFESLGCRHYPGVARNLADAWQLGHTKNALARFGAVDQLELVLSCLVREKISVQPLPALITQYLAPLRGPVEELVGYRLNESVSYLENQHDFGLCVLQILELLGFSTKSAKESASAPPDTDISAIAENESPVNDDEDGEVSEQIEVGGDEQRAVNENALPEAVLAIVRHTEQELATEADDSEIDNIIETNSQQSPMPSAKQMRHYRVFDSSSDEECAASELADAARLRSLRAQLDSHIQKVDPLVTPLANKLQHVLLAKKKSYWTHDLHEGELDPQRLSRLVTAPQSALCYREQLEARVRDTTVTLLIDNSRSMAGSPLLTAAACADLVTRILERCNVSSEVLGFTTVSMYGGSVAERWQAVGCPSDAGRLNSLRHIVYKSARQTWRRSRENFGLMLDKSLLKQNIDGEALLWAVQRMRKRSESRRILMVLSDGRPSDTSTQKANTRHFLAEHLRQTIHVIENHSRIDLLAIGIGHDVAEYYTHSTRVDDIEQLGTVVLSKLTGLLRQ